MSSFTQLIGVLSGVPSVAKSGDTVDFTGFTLTGVTTQGLDDATAQVELDGSGNLTTTGLVSWAIDPSGAFSFDGGGASNVTVDSASLTVSTTTSGSLILDGVALVDINAGANLDIDVTGTFDMLASGAMSLDATGASNMSVASGDLTLATTTSGGLILSSAGLASIDAAGAVTVESSGAGISIGADDIDQPVDIGTAGERTVTIGNSVGAAGIVLTVGTGDAAINIGNSRAEAFKIANSGDSTTPLSVNSTDKLISHDYAVALNQSDASCPVVQEFGPNSFGAYAVNTLLTIDPTTGKFSTFDCETDKSIMGPAFASTAGANQSVRVSIGGVCNVNFDSAPAAGDIGKFVYALGATGSNSGKVSLTPPTASGSRVFKVGVLIFGNGSLTATTVLWQPQFLYDVD